MSLGTQVACRLFRKIVIATLLVAAAMSLTDACCELQLEHLSLP